MISNLFTHDMSENNEFIMSKMKYMPYFEIKPMATIDFSTHDILNSANPNAQKENDYDLTKLGQYIKIMMLTRHRDGKVI